MTASSTHPALSRSGAPADPAELRRAATAVLLRNWTGRSTVPSRGLYPHQWSWDSAFITLGLRHVSARRAQQELESLLGAQWADGRLPHIVFDPATPSGAYFPGPEFWDAGASAAGPPAGVRTSGIIQPPVHALAAWETHRANPAESARRGFLSRVYPRLVAWHRYLGERRDLGGRGLAAIVHPWESGMDNSPVWDGPLDRVTPWSPGSFQRRDLDHAASGDRPTDLDYGRYLRLAADYRDHGYDDTAPHTFAAEDPALNALLILSEHALAGIAGALGLPAERHETRAAALTRALVDTLYDPDMGHFLARDLVDGERIRECSAAGLVPLAVPRLPVAGELLRTARGERFRLGHSHLVPSYDRTGHAFEPGRYWRGPGWFNVSWVIHRGLLRQGAAADAAALREQIRTSAAETGFAEYVDPLNGAGRGARDFSWTAATVLDLLAQESA
ncbi:hypothetical protein F4561_006103 [Lipingzhangella halophila]|uniref:Mannosylglycerate hydrolase MGH1-like glycoside hydrolase domain-containing protein n=1 Tax=Lipingzhangella halophila TaxID=1783352 RepID=A0A7W7RNF1_9ACTN|nr:hypothetical protein [Lipingzhangella halophila]MBB4935209.1 hypothetical protein [Lipingzhangella halophila]